MGRTREPFALPAPRRKHGHVAQRQRRSAQTRVSGSSNLSMATHLQFTLCENPPQTLRTVLFLGECRWDYISPRISWFESESLLRGRSSNGRTSGQMSQLTSSPVRFTGGLFASAAGFLLLTLDLSWLRQRISELDRVIAQGGRPGSEPGAGGFDPHGPDHAEC